MLVLTRKASEEILIGDDIKITLVRVRGNSVRVGIEAPREIRVVRAEIDQATPKSRPSKKHDQAESAPAQAKLVQDQQVFEGDISRVDRPGMELDDREAVFAHPQKKRPVRKPRKHRAADRFEMQEPSTTSVNRQLLVGRTSGDRRIIRLQGDLSSSSFVSAT